MSNIITRLGNLITVKSIISLVLTFVFAAMLLLQFDIPDVFMTVYTMVVGFFFGTIKKDDTLK